MVILFSKIMMREIPAIANMVMPSVDVRDVAEAHYQAFIKPNLHGERILIIKETISLKKIVVIL
jgi:hypothetical protein